mmetsp:Transcript_4339/g.13122  ORF Transcript_4339/g.13122 Transcript_4339/m.13122 type:complete len:375 (+) Transcript_4339:232-1356(+)
MAEMRHGISDAVEGHLFVRGRFALRRTKKYICLDSQTLLCSADKKAPVKMEIPISGAVITNNEHNRLIRIMNEKKRVTLYADTPEDYARWLEVLQKAACSNIEDFYEFGERLGEGAFATVYQGIDKTTLETFAIKVIDKGKADNEIEFIQRETRIMKTIDHPNVIKTYDVFDTKSNLYLVMEYMPGGTLADIMKAKLLRTEKTVKSVMFDILQGVAYLHRMHIVHRDLKLKNILCKNNTLPLEIKLADFGLSNNVGVRTVSRVALRSQVGSPHFVAPEILRDQPYGTAVDLWSCGVILHLLLTAKYPFSGKTVQDTLKLVCTGKVELRGPEWGYVSKEGQNFVLSLLEEDPEKRPTAEEALKHSWFSSTTKKKE